MSFNLIWESLVRSSLWVQESKETRLVWVTMLALKDKNGVVTSSVIGLADSAKVTVDECREALGILMAPDPNDTSKVDDGRRIREVPGGWQVVNNDRYKYSTEARRAYWAIHKAKQRAEEAAQWGTSEGEPKRRSRRRASPEGTPLPGESAYVETLETQGAAAAEAVVERHLPAVNDPKDGRYRNAVGTPPRPQPFGAGAFARPRENGP